VCLFILIRENKMENYRFNEGTGEFYVFDSDIEAYVFVNNFKGLSEAQAIAKYEQLEQMNGDY